MTPEERLRTNVRSVAVDAERHWWVQRLEALAGEWRSYGLITTHDCADEITALVRERQP